MGVFIHKLDGNIVIIRNDVLDLVFVLGRNEAQISRYLGKFFDLFLIDLSTEVLSIDNAALDHHALEERSAARGIAQDAQIILSRDRSTAIVGVLTITSDNILGKNIIPVGSEHQEDLLHDCQWTGRLYGKVLEVTDRQDTIRLIPDPYHWEGATRQHVIAQVIIKQGTVLDSREQWINNRA